MPNDSRTLVYRAQIEALFYAAKIAIKTRQADAFLSCARQLSALAEDIDVPSALRDFAAGLHRELGLGMADEGLEAIAQTIADLSGAAQKLQAAIDLVKQGQSHLFVPALADVAENALKKFNELKTAVDNIGGNLRNASNAQLGDIPDKLKKLLNDLDTLRTAGRA